MSTESESISNRIKLARANLPETLSDPKRSPVAFIPDYCYPPQVFEKDGHLVRIWRSSLNESLALPRRRMAVLELTRLHPSEPEPVTKYLAWSYSRNPKEKWAEYDWILHGHFPGDQPCLDLIDVYTSCTFEIRFVIDGLAGREIRRHRIRERRKQLRRNRTT